MLPYASVCFCMVLHSSRSNYQAQRFKKNPINLLLDFHQIAKNKGTVSVISIDSPNKDDNARFTTVPFV